MVEESSSLTAETTRATPVKVGNIWIEYDDVERGEIAAVFAGY